jgi:uncharacterized protein (TIGR00297 family)
VAKRDFNWQSKFVLLAVMPFTGAHVVLETHWWAVNVPALAIWTIGLSVLLGLIALKMRSATPAAAAAGALITASLMFSTAVVPYQPWRTALIPVLAVLVLTSLATRTGRAKKEGLGVAEHRTGRTAAQVAANLGVAPLNACEAVQSWLVNTGWFTLAHVQAGLLFAPMLAALCEAAADTASSEVGQVLGGRPVMITTLKRVDAGQDGAVSLAGTLAGIAAAAIVAAAGAFALHGSAMLAAVACAGGVFGLFFDSLLGATLEQQGWLGNDLVNFLSTASAAAFAIATTALLPHPGVG